MASSTTRPTAYGTSTNAPTSGGKSYFEQQREILLGEIGVSFEHVLANINKLNRSLEGVIAVGNEFSSVEALWSQFESVMAKDGEGVEGEGEEERREGEGGEEGRGGNGEGEEEDGGRRGE